MAEVGEEVEVGVVDGEVAVAAAHLVVAGLVDPRKKRLKRVTPILNNSGAQVATLVVQVA